MTKKNDAKDNPDEQKEAPEAEAQVETADSEVTAVLEDESLKERDKIRKLSEMGFSNPQIIELGFTRSEVYRACPVNRKGLTSRADGFSLPAVLKAGGGIEVVSPEAILQSIFPQANADMQSLMKGMMLYRAAQMAVLTDVEIMKGQAEADAKRMQPILKLMEETRKEQDAAAQRARESVMDVARETAESTLGGAIGYLDQFKPKPPPAKTGEELMAKRVDGMLEMMQNMMFGQFIPGGQSSMVAEGWERGPVSRSETAAQAQGTPGPAEQQGADWEVETVGRDESEGEDGDSETREESDE